MSEQQQERSQESLRHEYAEVVQNIRHYSNLRFAIFTIFFAVIGGLGYGAFGKELFDEHVAMIARISGFGVIAVFWFYITRADQQFDHYVSEAIDLERSLGYKQYTRRPARHRYLPTYKVVARIFFSVLTLLWVYAVLTVPLT